MPTTAAQNGPNAAPAAVHAAPARDPSGALAANGVGDISGNVNSGGGTVGGYGQVAAGRAGAATGSGKKEDGDDFSQGMAAYKNRQYPVATQSFDRAGTGGDLSSSLWAARSVRDGQGCAQAISRFDSVAARGGASFVGAEATFDGAQCYAQVGSVSTARAKYTQLLNVPSHAQRAQQALDGLNQVAASREAKAPAKPAAPPPAQAAPQASQAGQAAGQAPSSNRWTCKSRGRHVR